MPNGYHGKILKVDLSSGQIEVETPSDDFYRRYLGGGALATYYLLTEMDKGVDPLGPDNLLVFAFSVVNGGPAAGSTRYTTACKSPLTGGFAEAEAGGWFAPEFKQAGFDAVVFKGRSPKPVYLWVKDGKAELRDASSSWGKITGDAQEAIRAELGEPRARMAMIGPAGEKMVRYACVLNEMKHANGRAGTGAVMGSKNLKAVVARGTLGVNPVDAEAVRQIARDFNKNYVPDGMQDCGTANGLMGLNAGGILPTRNFREGSFEGAEAISGQTMRDTILVNRGTCFACPVRCKREVKVEERGVEPKYGGPEYETLGSFGSVCGVDDLGAVALANQVSNQYGVDTISAGMAIAFAMDCYEAGLITKEDTGGIDLKFGNAEGMLQMLRMIVDRKGFGDVLAEGALRAAAKIGKGAEQYAMVVKGQELPMHEPRGKNSVGLAYAISPTGADHMEAEHDMAFVQETEAFKQAGAVGIFEPVPAIEMSARKARQFFYLQNLWSLYNSLGWCDFVLRPAASSELPDMVKYVKAMTGWETSLWELFLKVGERANTMSRIFNLREGFTAKDDTLPERLFGGLEGGTLKGQGIDKEQFAKALHSYYGMVGWDEETGIPTEAKVEELDIAWAAEYLPQ